MVIRIIIGHQCLYCGTIFEMSDPHPPALEFINGHPSPCRKTGEYGYYVGKTADHEIPWLRVAYRDIQERS